MVTKLIKCTDDGTVAYVQSEILIDGLPNRVLEILYDYGTFKKTVRESLRTTAIHTVVSHEPIFTVREEKLIGDGVPVQTIILEQRFKDGEEDYIDDFGFYIYLHHTFTEGIDTIDDTRFEKIKPPGT